MKEHPILFSTPMVQAILEGRKTMTRRIVKPQPNFYTAMEVISRDKNHPIWTQGKIHISDNIFKGHLGIQWKHVFGAVQPNVKFRYGSIADVLWVRETWFPTRFDYNELRMKEYIRYKADGNYDPKKDCVGRSWKSSIHMPRWACRIRLRITDIKVERVMDITEEDAKAEGVKFQCGGCGAKSANERCIGCLHPFAKEQFQLLWKEINGEESWSTNPYVWVINFEKI